MQQVLFYFIIEVSLVISSNILIINLSTSLRLETPDECSEGSQDPKVYCFYIPKTLS